MSWLDYLTNLEGSKQLIQYPDTRLYNAAAALNPEERPRVPVRLTDDWQETYKGFGRDPGRRFNNPRAFVNPDKSSIFVNKKTGDYKKPGRLSGLLAHEAFHLENGNLGGPNEEEDATRRELSVLDRLGQKSFARKLRDFYGIK